MEGLLNDLTEPQRAAVTHTHGPLLVLAGAGSGKTRVITRRAAYLASTVTTPNHILAITFTNKAAGEMRERVESLGLSAGATVTTFHSLGARLLRWFAGEAGLEPNFTIFDDSDSRSAMKKAMAKAGLSTANWHPGTLAGAISDAKTRLLLPEAYAREMADAAYEQRTIARVYSAYQAYLEQQNAVDFDDLLLRTAHLLKDHPALREQLEDRYRYVLIDEYQDTNHAQYMIARGLTLKNENICATGDPDQSIYAWRGADIRNILEFEEDYPKARVVRLEQNYRSTQRICTAASQLIGSNLRRKKKNLWTDNEAGDKIRVVECASTIEEGDLIAERIQQRVREGRPLSDFAVFYRVNALSRSIEESLLRAGIHYQVARGTAFYSRKEIKDLLAWLRVLVNPADQVALARAMTTPSRGIGKTTLDRLADFAGRHAVTMLDAARRVEDIEAIHTAATRKVRAFVELIDRLLQGIEQPPEVIAQGVYEASGMNDAIGKSEDPEDALENINELISAAADFTLKKPDASLAEWLQQIALVSDVDAVENQAGCVTLMTLHAAKGLEFQEVFIVALENGLLPHERREGHTDLEEERRLLFVGMTRARKYLTLTRAQWRRIHGMNMQTDPSPFLKELPSSELDWLDTTVAEPSYKARPEHSKSPAGDYSRWKPGTYLRHPKFGVGQLMWTSGGGSQTRAGLRFPAYGEKTLILEYARLEPLDPDECQL